jgi:hypothetical protein
MTRVLGFLGACLISGCGGDPVGCTKDADCKGTRVCFSGECVDGAGGVSSGTTSSEGGSPTGCDGQGSCQACIECASGSECSDAQQACIQSPDCTGLLECLVACDFDDVCEGGCYASYPDSAAEALSAFEVCVTCACPLDCQSCQ